MFDNYCIHFEPVSFDTGPMHKIAKLHHPINLLPFYLQCLTLLLYIHAQFCLYESSPERDRVRQEHEDIIAQLNQRMAEKAR